MVDNKPPVSSVEPLPYASAASGTNDNATTPPIAVLSRTSSGSSVKESPAEKAVSDGASVEASPKLDTPGEAPPSAAHPRPPSQLKDFFSFRRRKAPDGVDLDLDAIATQPSVFDDPEFAKQYAPHPKWENWHRFDPKFRWTWREEKALVRKLDWRIAMAAFVFFFCLDLDRENISQANSDNMLKDLHLTTDDYNLGNTLFKVAFLCAELPSQMISKRVGADRWVPTQMVVWSLFSGAQFWMTNRASFLALRFFIGLLQGGFIPDVILWLSYFYPKNELPLRLAFFWCSNYLVKIVSPFLALGLLRLRGVNGESGWQYLFLIEGVLTLFVGIMAFFHMPASPTETKNFLYRKGWFTEREEYITVNRVIRDDPSKGSMHNRQGINLDGFTRSLLDFDMWPLYLIGLVFMIPCYPVANYLTLQLKYLGFSTEATNALSVPAPTLGFVFLIVITLLSEVVDNRSFVAMSMSVWNAPLIFALYALPADGSRWTYWAVASLQQAYPYVHALQVAWISRQSGSVRTRTISAAIYNMLVQVSAIIGSNVYQSSDAPLYRKANLAMGILSVANCFLYVGAYFYYRWRNASRERIWNSMTKEEQIAYLATTNDQGNRRLDWRFAY